MVVVVVVVSCHILLVEFLFSLMSVVVVVRVEVDIKNCSEHKVREEPVNDDDESAYNKR